MKLEIGGGIKPRGDGFINIDIVSTADIVHDLNSKPWPIEDDCVDDIYSSHCLEHLADPMSVLAEMARVGVIGCPVELRVPHPISDLSMVWDHKHVFSPIAAINAETYFPGDHWRGLKRLKLNGIQYHASILLEEAKNDLPFLRGIPDEKIMKWIPRTCHECSFLYTVVVNEFAE